MMIGSVVSNNYYMGMGQMSAMGSRSPAQGMPGPPQGAAMGGRPDPAAVFSKVDQDGSGGLDATEFQALTDKISEATGQEVDVEELFATYDTDGDGALSEEETQTALEANRPAGPPPGGMMGPMGGMGGMPGGAAPDSSQIFSDTDEDGNGTLDESEVQGLADMISQATGQDMDAAELIAAFDADEDGVLNEEETTAALEANRPDGPPPGGMMGPMGGMGGMPGGAAPDSSQIFSDTDEDGNGTLDESEVQGLADMISQATGQDMDAAELIAAFDADEDGVLNEEETTAALEANRPDGPPPQEGMRSEAASSMSALSPGFQRYLQAAAMGMEQNQTNNWFSMGGGANGSGNPGGWFNSVNTWS